MTRFHGLAFAGAVLGLVIVAVPTGCSDGTNVCTGCCSKSGLTYCKDGWTQAECKDWDSKGVNGVKWNFHGGQTCAGRGTPATP